MTAVEDDIGQYRADGPESMFAGAVFVGPKVKGQRANILDIVRDFGPLTDHDTWERYKQTYSGEILLSTIHARRRELVKLNLIGDTGLVGDSPKSTVKCIRWGLVASISPEQRRRNLLAESTAAQALTYAFTRLKDESEQLQFLRWWYENDWDMILIFHSDFAQLGSTEG